MRKEIMFTTFFLGISLVALSNANAAADTTGLPADWKSLELGRLADLYRQVESLPQSASLSAKSQISSHAAQKYFADAIAAKRLSAVQLADALYLCASALNDAQKKQFAEALTTRFEQDPHVWNQLDVDHFNDRLVGVATKQLPIPRSEIARWMVSYVNDGKAWREARAVEIAKLILSIRQLKKGSTRGLELGGADDALVNHLWDRYLVDAKHMEALDPASFGPAMYVILRSAVFNEKRRLHLNKTFVEFIESRTDQFWDNPDLWNGPHAYIWHVARELQVVPAKLVAATAKRLNASRPPARSQVVPDGPQQEIWQWCEVIRGVDASAATTEERATIHAAIANEVLKRLKQGPLISISDWCFASLGSAFSSDDQLKLLREELFDKQGRARPDVARLLAWSYQDEGLKTWRAFLEQQIKDAMQNPDQRACWMLAAAYVAEVSPLRTADVSGGWRWVQKALATAESEQVRLWCVEAWTERSMDLEQYDQTDSFLKSVKPQFSSASATAKFDAIAQDLAERRYRQERHRMINQGRADDAWMRSVKERMEAARAAGKEELVKRYEQMLNAH